MKRGFLNTPRGKRAIERVEISESETSPRRKSYANPGRSSKKVAVENTPVDDDVSMASTRTPRGDHGEDRGKQKAVDSYTDDDTTDRTTQAIEMLEGYPADDSEEEPPPGFIHGRPLLGRPGWGRSPQEEFYHKVPEPHSVLGRKRTIFRQWPRKSHGENIIATHRMGTQSPDGYPWGETLYDFFAVHRIPNVPGFVSYMTSSALVEATKAIGELEVAAPEIEWAKSEGQPRVDGVADTEELIFCCQTRVRMLTDNPSDDENNEGDEKEWYDRYYIDNVPTPRPPEVSVTSPFHSSHYPEPWPTTPFKNSHSILLQDRIPMHLLPEKLYVHDPFCLLPALQWKLNKVAWGSRPDNIHTYNLNLSLSTLQEVQAARKKAEELEEFKSRTLVILRYKRTKQQIKNYEPVIEVPLPPYPHRPTKVEESHLYLSPASKAGVGNHSVVYKAEWEVPRDLFVKPKICPLCFEESAEKEIKRLKDTGRWAKMMKAASWGPKGYTGRQPTKAELDEVNDPVNLARDGEIIEREITCIVPPSTPPAKILDILDRSGVWDMFIKEKTRTTALLDMTGPGDGEMENGSHARLRIDPPFSYESQKTCKHDRRQSDPAPRTAMFTVIAKLSIEYDPHLAREAQNYQEFPERLFHHFNGYTILPQLKAVVPVGAIVPQFFGYYTPGPESTKEGIYLSPILLLEHCGTPIEPEKHSMEDQEECASLVLRFQRAGWLQESMAQRNLLVQYGKPTEFPLTRMVKPEPSFRLIDFGRSRKWRTTGEKRNEEVDALMMFSALKVSMGITLDLR